MNDVVIKNDIEDLIYKIRGVQVMLDSDLAKLYKVETKQLNRQVKRNIERFDKDFMFQLTNIEYQNLKCQIGTSNNYGGRRTLPYVFTELGVTTLASILHSEVAIKMSKKIIKAFVMMRRYISSDLIEQKYINKLVLEDCLSLWNKY
ncbi:MAG: ORF6N domain-containing protein [Bacilli bacterium]|nr:ORF6N domain-containing protein [Bacilli bacterium]